MPTVYRLAPGLLVRTLGAVLVAAGVVLVLAAVVIGVLDWPRAVFSVVLVVVVLGVVGAGVAAWRMREIVRLDESGYRVRARRGAGVRSARWREVEDVVTAVVSGQRCVVLRLRDGGTTTLPVALLHASPEAFVADLTRHLDAGHGYRRLS